MAGKQAEPIFPDTEREPGPNTIASDRKRLCSYVGARGFGPRGKRSIGLINNLAAYEYYPFWHSLLSALGYQVMVPDTSRVEQFNEEDYGTVSYDRICTPAKAANKLILEMIDRGVEAIFMPAYFRHGRCPVFCGYARLVRSNIPAIVDGSIAIIDPALDSVDLRDLFETPDAFTPIREALIAFDESTAPTLEEFDAALRSAMGIQRDHDDQRVADLRRSMDWIHDDDDHHGVIIASRPYQLARNQIQGIDEKLSQRGFAVLSPISVKLSLNEMDRMRSVEPPSTHEALIRRIAETSIDDPDISVLFLQSDHCGFDTLAVIEARQILSDGHRRTAAILLDETKDEGAIDSQIEGFTRDILAEKKQKDLEDSEVLTPAEAIRKLVGDYGAESERVDLGNLRDNLPQHLCKAVESLFKLAKGQLEEEEDSSVAHLPPTCKECLAESLPSLLSHEFGRPISVAWDGSWRFPEERLSQPWAFDGKENPRIGLAGHPLLCFNPVITEPVASLISEYGGYVVLPNPDRFNADDHGYRDQLDEFRDQGVDGVLYLQYPDCLKNFVSGQGAIQSLQRLYPDMPLVSIGFDSDTTPIQLENRISLVIALAQENLRAEGEGNLEPEPKA